MRHLLFFTSLVGSLASFFELGHAQPPPAVCLCDAYQTVTSGGCCSLTISNIVLEDGVCTSNGDPLTCPCFNVPAKQCVFSGDFSVTTSSCPSDTRILVCDCAVSGPGSSTCLLGTQVCNLYGGSFSAETKVELNCELVMMREIHCISPTQGAVGIHRIHWVCDACPGNDPPQC